MTKLIKLLIITPDYSPAIGGVEKFVKTLVTHLPKDKFAVRILAGTRLLRDVRAIKTDVIEGIAVTRIPTMNPGGMDFPRKMAYYRKIWQELAGADLVHLNDIRVFFTTTLVGKLFFRYKLVLTSNGLIFHTQRNRLLKKIYASYFCFCLKKWFAKVVAIGHADKTFFDNKKIASLLIEDGIDFKKYNGIQRVPVRGHFLYFGRISANKNIESLIKSFAVYSKIDSQCKLFICGAGEPVLVAKLQNLVQQYDLENRIEFCGRMSDDQLHQQLSKAELVFFPSLFESFGYALIEAMAVGCTVIAHANAQFKYMLGDTQAAYLVDIKNSALVVDVITAARHDYQAYNNNAANLAAKYDVDEMLKKYENLFLSL